MKYKSFLILSLFLISAIQAVTSYSQVTWEPTHGPYGGHINSVAALSNDIILAAGGLYELYRTTDAGLTWEIALTSNSDIMRIATDGAGTVLVANWWGYVYKSEDFGASWVLMPYGDITGANLRALRYYDGAYYAGTNDGLFRSVDGGYTWVSVISDDIFDVTKTQTNVLYAASSHDVNHSSGIYRSTDQGLNWMPTEQLRPIEPGDIYTVYSIAGNSDETVFAGTSEGLYMSGDDGESCQITGLNSGNVWSLIIMPDDIIVAGLDLYGVKYSVNNGSTWINTNISDRSVRGGFSKIQDSNLIWVGTHNGVHVSDSNPQQWRSKGVPLPIRDISSHNEQIYVLTGAFGSNVYYFRSPDFGDTWEYMNMYWPGNYPVHCLEFDSSGFAYIGMTSSSMGGQEGAIGVIAPGSTNAIIVGFLPYNVAEVPDILATANNRVFVGTDTGIFELTGYFPDQEFSQAALSGTSVSQLLETSNDILLAATASGISYSSDGGDTWESSDLVNPAIALAHGFDRNGAFFAATSDNFVFTSEDDGQTWLLLSSGLQNEQIQCLGVDVYGDLWAGTANGIFVFDIENDVWEMYNNEMSAPNTLHLYSMANNELFAGTTFGLYRANFEILEIDNAMENSNEMLSQNLACYPNPFNHALNISFTIGQSQPVSLKIYNTAGQLVKTLIDQYVNSGEYNMIWQGNDHESNSVSSGTYFCQLKFGKETYTARVIIQK